MAQTRVRLLHRIAVDWVADTFGLRTPDARTRHENARFRAAARAGAAHDRASAHAARLPARLHARLPARLHAERGESRVLNGWQASIGSLLDRRGGRA
jgi:hypothetical protein